MPQRDVDRLEVDEPGFLQSQLDDWSAEIDDRLRKRYAVPFASPTPRTVLRWLTKLVTREAYDKRGRNPSSEQDQSAIDGAAEQAERELREAADAKDGLFELPLRADQPDVSGVTVGEPLGRADADPYAWMDRQRATSRGYGT